MAEPLWTSDEIVTATGGNLNGAPFAATGVSIDTRSIEPGDLFVALAGVRDGHEFIDPALAKGAAGSLAAKPVAGSAIIVPDVLAGLEKLGEAARDRADALRCAVTGSVGKTSVTQAIRAGLTLAGPAHSSVKSYNNHIGVPLTLARMPRETRRAVFEIGMNHAGEITPLVNMVQPDVVVITTVGPVHTENFPDGEFGVATAKAEIFDGLKVGGVAVLNAENKWFDLLLTKAIMLGADVVTFGEADDCDARLTGFTLTATGADVRAVIDDRELTFPILQTGHHWGLNSLAVILALKAMDVPLETALAALATFEPLEGRGAERAIAGFVLIDESYNANPISMAAAIRGLGARQTTGRRIVALTDMLELGAEGPQYHAALAKDVEAAGVDLVFCAGPLMKSLWDALPPTRRGGYADTADALAPQVVQAVEPGDVVMVKGSNGSKAQAIAQALVGLDARGGSLMFYWLYQHFGAHDYVPGLNLLKYITFRTVMALFTGQIVVGLMGSRFIRWMQAKQGKGQPIRADGIERHVVEKAGTPTMGGFMILAGLVVGTLLWSDLADVYVWMVVGITSVFGLLGFLDDYAKVTKQTTAGVSGRLRLAMEFLAAGLAVAAIIYFGPQNHKEEVYSTAVAFPLFKRLLIDLGWFYVAFGAFVIVGAANAVNFTDGLDGLAIVPVMIASAAFGLIAYLVGNAVYAKYLQLPFSPGAGELSVFCGALIGSGLGFLWYNAPPAKIFMGDTGSLALGGAIGAVAVATKHEIVLGIVGGLFVLETVSVMVQVVSFKLTGKRVFRMAPIHHHFEKLGWAKSTVVVRFWIISVVLALIGLATLKLR